MSPDYSVSTTASLTSEQRQLVNLIGKKTRITLGEAEKALGKKKVSEYDKESKGKKLPTRVKKSNALKTAIMKK